MNDSPLRSVLFTGEIEGARIHFTRIRPLKVRADGEEARNERESPLSLAESVSSAVVADIRNSRQGRGYGTTTVTGSGVATSGGGDGGGGGSIDRSSPVGPVLCIASVSFSLSIAASAARRAAPRLILASGERGEAQDAVWHSTTPADGGVGYLARGPSRAGTRNPSWKGKDNGIFSLSLAGLVEPELYIGVEDGKVAQARRHDVGDTRKGGGGGGRSDSSENAILADACIPVPVKSLRAGGEALEVELRNGAGTVRLEWSTHDSV